MITLADIKLDGSDYLDSLLKLLGDKKVTDIQGYISDPYGGGTSFKLCTIVFDDGTEMHIEGEHDYPYVTSSVKQPNFDEDTLERLYRESNDE